MCGHGYYRHKCSKSSEIVETETERSRLSVIKESKTIKVYCLNFTISVDPDPVPSCALSYIKHFIVVGDNVRCVFAVYWTNTMLRLKGLRVLECANPSSSDFDPTEFVVCN